MISPHLIVPPHDVCAGSHLASWAKQGVLLLNTCLTVRAANANSHSGHGWERFTRRALEVVQNRLAAAAAGQGDAKGVVFLAWGAGAGKLVKDIVKDVSFSVHNLGTKCFSSLLPSYTLPLAILVKTKQKQHHVLTSTHPSPLSAHRGFLGNGHFKKCNEWLQKTYGQDAGIDWGAVMKD